jgi:protein O-GlcNAc transferase
MTQDQLARPQGRKLSSAARGTEAADGLRETAEALFAQGNHSEAFKQVRQAIALDPQQPGCYVLLGHIFRETGHPAEAHDCYRACLELAPDHVTALICLGNLARDQRQTHEARLCYERALQVKPGDPNIQCNLANVLCDVGDMAEAIRLLEASLCTHPTPLTHSNLLLTLHYDSRVTPERLHSEHRAWAARYASGIPRLPLRNDFKPERKLRLGFVSADFKNHPVGRLMEVLWRHLDRELLDLVVYDAGTRQDQLTDKLRTLAGPWKSIHGLDDAGAAALIRDDRVDVLFDLSGHTAGNRLLVFAHKPAPIQVTWFAYPNTTGLETMDYRITDALADPPGEAERRYTEKLVRLPHTAWLYRAPEEELPVRPLPCTRGQPFTFGCLNNPAKASEASLSAWAAILRQVPESRLLLLARNDEDSLHELRGRFRREGVNDAQLCFVPQAAPQQFYQYHYDVDLMLDPFPYNGAVTTADALWMGVPVLSLAGGTYVSRQGVCLLTNLGLEDWICRSVGAYVQKAVTFARSPRPLVAMSSALRPRLQQSPLMDARVFAQAFSGQIRAVWRQRCSASGRE